ncbi:MAG TPA: M48 family metallopeptidase, partial [Anaerolineaceae bacterium]|nr:M48 family metallopeptidase [Anaerolineaceae bacterium]
EWTANPWLIVAGYTIVFGGVFLVLNLPLSYYEGFVLPHRFGQSNQTLRGWVIDQVKSLALSGVFGLVMVEAVYWLLRVAGDAWWLWAAGMLLFVQVVMANLAPVLIMPIFYKVVPLDADRADLAARLMRLAEQAGTRVRGVYQIDMSRRTKSANAMLMGLGNTRRIVLGDTLLNEFTDDEIETVLAHELGHHVHRDIPMGILVSVILTLIGFYAASLVLQWGVNAFGLPGVWDVAAMPVFLLAMGLYGLITTPLENAFSRWRERRADRYALEATNKPQAFAAAMTRLANQNLADADPEPWVEWLLYSHPALQKRIAMANQYQASTRFAG